MQPLPSSSGGYQSGDEREDLKIAGSRMDSLAGILLGRRGYIFMAAPLAALFAIYYYILEPSNFASFSDTLRYFISALSTLLAVVVSFNTLALRSQLNNMPTDKESLDRQLNKIDDLLQPALRGQGRQPGDNPALYYSDAIKTMMAIARRQAESIISPAQDTGNLQQVCRDFIRQTGGKLEAYRRHKNPFFLISVSTTAFVERIKFANPGDEKTEKLFETLKRLHVLRNIGVRIFIRNSLTKLSFDMLVFTIPIIVFAAIISAISNYGSYNTMFLRVLFAASMSTVALPFILLFIRTIPVLRVIQSSSSIPFTREEQ